jgi:hypothetical protein
MFFNLIGSNASYDQYKGMLLEDVVGLSLRRILGPRLGSSINYDASEGGADFITSVGGKKIALEVGYGIKNFQQVEASMKRYGGDYGLSVSTTNLAVNETANAVTVPYTHFLLI